MISLAALQKMCAKVGQEQHHDKQCYLDGNGKDSEESFKSCWFGWAITLSLIVALNVLFSDRWRKEGIVDEGS